MDKEIDQIAQFTKVQSNNRDFARLVSTAHQISDLTPHSGEPFSTRAKNFITLEKILKAIDDLSSTINLKSPLAKNTLVLAHFWRGNIHSKLQNWQDSIIAYNLTISLDPKLTNAHFNKANSLMQ
jgi:tetratricopeptide (TPR) repeat protein